MVLRLFNAGKLITVPQLSTSHLSAKLLYRFCQTNDIDLHLLDAEDTAGLLILEEAVLIFESDFRREAQVHCAQWIALMKARFALDIRAQQTYFSMLQKWKQAGGDWNDWRARDAFLAFKELFAAADLMQLRYKGVWLKKWYECALDYLVEEDGNPLPPAESGVV